MWMDVERRRKAQVKSEANLSTSGALTESKRAFPGLNEKPQSGALIGERNPRINYVGGDNSGGIVEGLQVIGAWLLGYLAHPQQYYSFE